MKTHEEYMKEKRQEILNSIKPKLNAWGVYDFDYEYTLNEAKTHTKTEYLRIERDYIGCLSNSLYAVELEVLGWLFERIWRKGHTLGAFDIQSRNVIKRYWRKTNENTSK